MSQALLHRPPRDEQGEVSKPAACQSHAGIARAMRVSTVLALWCLVATARAEDLPAQLQLPAWALPRVEALASRQALVLSTRINPFVWRGDFDGDGRADLALLVEASASRKQGIALVFAAERPPLVLGAGNEVGNGGDDFAWMDQWCVEDGQRGADALLVAKEGAASALIRLQAGTPVWEQRGD